MLKNSFNFFKKHFFFRMHPDAALRYLPIVELLRKNKWDNKKTLEIGSGSYGITPYLKKEITGVDISFDEPQLTLLKKVQGSADNLPFKDNEFEIVILSDVLEHMPSEKRKASLFEAIRVGSLAIVISGPFGKEAFCQDQELANYSLRVLGKMHPYYKDHLEYGLPNLDDLMLEIKSNHKVEKTKIIGQFLNLNVRKWLMKFSITKNKLIFNFYLKGLMFLVPFLRLMNKKPCYRTLILLQLKND